MRSTNASPCSRYEPTPEDPWDLRKVAHLHRRAGFGATRAELGENGSGGTDHGTAAPVFLLGRPVEPGLHGPYPDLARLEDGDPVHAVDFRSVHAALLDRWLEVPHPVVLGTRFEPMPVLPRRRAEAPG
jgi:uncharacterized protein (DUF1501 family)